MLYTVGIGFTNYSSENLLDQETARAYLLDAAVAAPDSQRTFTLHAEGGQFRIHIEQPVGVMLTTPPLPLLPLGAATTAREVPLQPADATAPAAALPLREVIPHLPALRELRLMAPGATAPLRLISLREFAAMTPLYRAQPDGSLVDTLTQTAYRADDANGYYTAADGSRLTPGYRVAVGLRHYATLFSESRFREPFMGVFVWTVVFSALSILFAAGLGLLLSVLLNWDALPFKGAYRLVLFLPYAVPGFISILVFKGLFNQNLGEINFILNGLFGIRPAWFSDPLAGQDHAADRQRVAGLSHT